MLPTVAVGGSALLLAALAGAAPPPAPSVVYVYDLSYTSSLLHVDRYEHLQFVAALSGLMNRDAARLYTPLLLPGGPVDGGSAADQDCIRCISIR